MWFSAYSALSFLSSRSAGVLAVLLIVAGAVFLIDHRGYQRAERHCEERIAEIQAEINAETARQMASTDIALRLARQQVTDLIGQKDELEMALGDLENAASQDPDAGRVCLGPGSVQRLNAIR